MLAARQGSDRLARLGKTGGGGEDGVRDDVLLLSMTQSAEPNFFLASAPIRLKSANRWCMTLPSEAAIVEVVGDDAIPDAVADGDGPPSTHEVPPSGISVTFTSAKSCRRTQGKNI